MDKNNPKEDGYKTVKVPLKYCIKDSDDLSKINKYVISANTIVIHALQFIKLYILHSYDKGSVPIIDEVFINSCLKTVAERSKQGRKATTNQDIMLHLQNRRELSSQSSDRDRPPLRRTDTSIDQAGRVRGSRRIGATVPRPEGQAADR